MEKIYLHFENVSLAEANRLAGELQEKINNQTGEYLPLRQTSDNHQDAGSILEIILASKAIVEVAKGISAWLVRNNHVKVSYKNKEGEDVTIENLDAKDERLIDLLKMFLK